MPQIDFCVLSNLTSILFALCFTAIFIAVHTVFLRQWLDAAVKIAFVVQEINEARLIRAALYELSFLSFFCADFLEQFIIFVLSATAFAITLYYFWILCTFMLTEFLSFFFANILRSILFAYSTLEVLFLRKFVPFLFSALILIFIFNIVGMLPGAFTVTSSLCAPFFFGLVSFYLWFFQIFLKRPALAMKYFLHNGTNFFIAPLITLIEIISNFSKFISLSVRLFANMFAGHLLLKAFYSFIYILAFNLSLNNIIFGGLVLSFTFFIVSLELLIAFLQAYVALLLVVLYLSGVRAFAQGH